MCHHVRAHSDVAAGIGDVSELLYPFSSSWRFSPPVTSRTCADLRTPWLSHRDSGPVCLTECFISYDIGRASKWGSNPDPHRMSAISAGIRVLMFVMFNRLRSRARVTCMIGG